MSTRRIVSGALAAAVTVTVLGPAPAVQAADSKAVSVSSSWRHRFIYKRMNGVIKKSGGIASEPFVKDAHPRGPTWVNSPRGVDKLGTVTTNPAINVQKAFKTNVGR
ncbi:MAG: hypothetical protein R3D62_12290 [Xanthobacteraceae bacterium]